MRTTMLVLMAGLVGCNGNGVDDEECWYCDDETGDTDSQDTDSQDTDGKDTDGKDTDGGDKEGVGMWSGALSVADGTGSFAFQSESCELSYPVTVAREITDCGPCDFAWEITLDAPTVTVNDNCGGVDGYAGAQVPYGHQDPDVLLSGKGDNWSVAGQSNVKDGMWYFTQGGGGK